MFSVFSLLCFFNLILNYDVRFALHTNSRWKHPSEAFLLSGMKYISEPVASHFYWTWISDFLPVLVFFNASLCTSAWVQKVYFCHLCRRHLLRINTSLMLNYRGLKQSKWVWYTTRHCQRKFGSWLYLPLGDVAIVCVFWSLLQGRARPTKKRQRFDRTFLSLWRATQKKNLPVQSIWAHPLNL